jgi:excinuclease ABC subunit A
MSKLTNTQKQIAAPILKELKNRLGFLNSVGLNYLSLNRTARTLSGGESQRIRLASQIGSGLTGVLYVLDEPSIGLHQKDNDKLIDTLKHLRDLGNTVIVVEHDEDTIANADWIVDVGPKAGEHGGEIVFSGSIDDFRNYADSVTADFVSHRRQITRDLIVARARENMNLDKDLNDLEVENVNTMRDEDVEGQGIYYSKLAPRKNKLETKKDKKNTSKAIKIIGANENNLKNVTVSIPLGKFVCVTGASGSGKSTLINEILGKALMREIYDSNELPGSHKSIEGMDNVDKIVIIDQSPIGRTPRSNSATYTGVFNPIREIFAATRESKLRGYKVGRFSFNTKGGRCEKCKGDGVLKIEMNFLPDVEVTCEECHGKRYNRETLEIDFKGKNIADILEMTVEEAVRFFENVPSIYNKLKTLDKVGLGYIRLGQSATTLSGGEAQRVKLATELAKRQTGQTFYLLDEPTTGLHFADVENLLVVLHSLVLKGNTVLCIEHNLDVIKTADHIIDLGPEGGDKGGEVIAVGTVEDIINSKRSYTGKYLAKSQ